MSILKGRKCRKCGGKCSRRRADFFSCRRCGVQPGQSGFDRGGRIPSAAQSETTEHDDGAMK